MIVELDRKDLINLLRGTTVYYDQMKELIALGLGSYTGGFADRWDWEPKYSHVWEKYSEEQLFELYHKLNNK